MTRRSPAHTIIEALIGLVFVLCLPVWGPLAFLVTMFNRRRVRKCAKAFVCVNCGNVLGSESVARADDVWSRYVRELHRHSNIRYRLLRTFHAICCVCGTRYFFRKHERLFVVEASSWSEVSSNPTPRVSSGHE
jgi:hypothetical protein